MDEQKRAHIRALCDELWEEVVSESNAVVVQLLSHFRKQMPKRRLELRCGMGTILWAIDGRILEIAYNSSGLRQVSWRGWALPSLAFIAEAAADLRELADTVHGNCAGLCSDGLASPLGVEYPASLW